MHAPEFRQDDPIHKPAPQPTGSHDPVCGMTVSNESQFSTEYEGEPTSSVARNAKRPSGQNPSDIDYLHRKSNTSIRHQQNR